MTHQSITWALDQRVPAEAGRVLIALGNYADHKTGEIKYDPFRIAEEACVSVKGLPGYLSALRRNGYLLQTERGRERHYWLNLERNDDPKWQSHEWDFKAPEIAAECDEIPGPRLAPSSAPQRFHKAAQTEQINKISAPPPGQPADQYPIVEGSKLDDEWTRYLRAHGKLREKPFIRSIVLKGGATARGYYMPSPVPPKEEEREQIAV